ncbi:MAG TPA: PEGA domain-containing protein, partial [Humisphaera sp.]
MPPLTDRRPTAPDVAPALRRWDAAWAFALSGRAAGLLAVMLLVAAAGGGCVSRPRLIVITAEPPDASISIDGSERAKGLFRDELSFEGGRTYTVRVARLGYTDETRVLDGSPDQDRISVTLKPRLKQVKVVVKPRLPASIRLDGRPVGGGERVEWGDTLEFTVDAQNQWIPHRVTAYRAGYREASATIRFTDPKSEYELNLSTETKSVMIRTDPPGADVYVNGRRVGVSPVLESDLSLEVDPVTNEYRPYQVRATKAGFEDAAGT